MWVTPAWLTIGSYRDARSSMARQQQLLIAFDSLPQPDRFKDHGPNGLQVEGKDQVRRIVSGVTAIRVLIEAAIEAGVAFLACGHHASERYGAPAVAGQVASQLGIDHRFADIDNPA